MFVTHVEIRSRKVDLVDDGDDFEIVLEREVHIGDGLCLNPLCRVDNEDCPLAGGKGTTDLVSEVHMAGSVDQVQFVFLAVIRLVDHAYGMRLDRDAAFLFQVHGVQKLGMDKVARFNGMGRFKETVRQSGLPVVDVCDNGKITYLVQVCHVSFFPQVVFSSFSHRVIYSVNTVFSRERRSGVPEMFGDFRGKQKLRLDFIRRFGLQSS